MKITLDLDALVADGKLSAAEAERLKGFAARDTGELGSNVLFALGAAAVACCSWPASGCALRALPAGRFSRRLSW